MRGSRGFLVLVALLSACSLSHADEARNILFYGNSFTIGSGSSEVESLGGVPAIVRELATAAGYPAPNVENAAVGGQTLGYHIANNTAVISNPQDFTPEAGFQWDNVVLQDYSTRPTMVGDRAQHRSDVVGMAARVRMHSPNVQPILYETWSRHPDHSFFTGTSPSFPGGPAQMQRQLREGYAQSAGDLFYVYDLVAPVAPVGDAWELTGWDNLHATDLYHAGTRGSYLAGLVLFGTIYDHSVIGLPKIFDSLSESEAYILQTYAEQVIPNPVGFTGPDCNENGIPDNRESDCNDNGIPDDCDITDGTSNDCDLDSVPDECGQMPILVFSDDFDADTSANWAILRKDDGDLATFAFDYGAIGLPSAPNSDGTTIGLKLEPNTTGGAADPSGLSLYPTGITLEGDAILEYDLYMSWDTPESTEFASAGLYHSGTKLNASSGISTDTDGIFFAACGDGYVEKGSYPTDGNIKDYNGYLGQPGAAATRLEIFTWDNAQPPMLDYFPLTPGDPIGFSNPGTPGRQWVHGEVIQLNGVITWKLNGHVLYEGQSPSSSGTIMIGCFDPFSAQSTSGNTFAIFDNVRVWGLTSTTGRLAACMTGPNNVAYLEETCCAADLDADGDVDLADFALLQQSYEAPPAVLQADQETLNLSAQQGESDSASVTIIADNGQNPTLTLEAVETGTQSAPAWLILPETATAGTPFTVEATSAQLNPGSYMATVTASSAGYVSATFSIALDVTVPSVPGTVLIDLGTYANETSGQARYWNNVTSSNMYGSITLQTTDNQPSGFTFRFPNSQWFTGANTSGPTSAAPGSNLDSLGYPSSVLADSLFGNDVLFSGAIHELAVIELSGMDTETSYDFIFTAARMSASDTRTADYTVIGTTSGTATLNAANNTTEYVSVTGITPNAAGLITIEVQKGSANNNSYGFFYLGAMEIRQAE